MEDVTRRRILSRVPVAGFIAAMPGVVHAASSPIADEDVDLERDKAFVMGAGMTEGEAECWKAAAEVAGKFFALPEMHPMDKQEIASAIHVIQNKLLSRPTYRKYLENMKASVGK